MPQSAAAVRIEHIRAEYCNHHVRQPRAHHGCHHAPKRRRAPARLGLIRAPRVPRRLILGAIVATDLFERFRDMDEGKLTRREEHLARLGQDALPGVRGAWHRRVHRVRRVPRRARGARGLHAALENVLRVGGRGALSALTVAMTSRTGPVSRTLGPHMVPELAERPVSPKSRLQNDAARDALRAGVQA